MYSNVSGNAGIAADARCVLSLSVMIIGKKGYDLNLFMLQIVMAGNSRLPSVLMTVLVSVG